MEGKICRHCNKFVLLDRLRTSKSKSGKICYGKLCFDCDNERRKNLARTVHGMIDKIYACNVRHSRIRGHKPPEYTKQELSDWLLVQPNFSNLYQGWVDSGFLKHYAPSIDRLDDYKGYSLSNIRLVTFKVNQKKAYIDRLNGTSKNGEICMPVVQISLDGEYLARYVSAMDAERKTGIGAANIRCCAMGRQKTAKNFVWVFEIEYKANPDKWHKITNIRELKIVQYSKSGDLIEIFDSAVCAAKKLNTSAAAINNGLRGRCRTCMGFVWKYAE